MPHDVLIESENTNSGALSAALVNALAAAFLLSSCSRLTLPECSFLCDANQRCPLGTCGPDGYCHRSGEVDDCRFVGADGGSGDLAPIIDASDASDASDPKCPGNLIANPGFEADLQSPGWVVATSGGLLDKTTMSGHDGSAYALRWCTVMTQMGTAILFYDQAPWFSGLVGESYSLTGWLRSESATAYQIYPWIEEPDSISGVATGTPVPLTVDWQPISMTFQPQGPTGFPSLPSRFQLTFRSDNLGGICVDLDDVCFRKIQ